MKANNTLWGIGAVLTAVGGALVAGFDGDASTNIDLAGLISTVLFAVALWRSRDVKEPISESEIVK